jgi:uncharacterized membrane protein YdjX (TVP38/TMEM64 family)
LHFLQNTRRLHFFVTVAFLLPGTPKDVLSYCVGLTPMRLSQWLLITSLCRLPSIVTSTIGGNALGEGNPLQAALVFAITMCISLTGLAVYHKFRTKAESDVQ